MWDAARIYETKCKIFSQFVSQLIFFPFEVRFRLKYVHKERGEENAPIRTKISFYFLHIFYATYAVI